jgi:hypothetical protein
MTIDATVKDARRSPQERSSRAFLGVADTRRVNPRVTSAFLRTTPAHRRPIFLAPDGRRVHNGVEGSVRYAE